MSETQPHGQCPYCKEIQYGPHQGTNPGHDVNFGDDERLYTIEEARGKYSMDKQEDRMRHGVSHGAVCPRCYEAFIESYRHRRD